jgi:hypothetical protein
MAQRHHEEREADAIPEEADNACEREG